MKKSIQRICFSIAFFFALGVHQDVFANDYRLVSTGGSSSASATGGGSSP